MNKKYLTPTTNFIEIGALPILAGSDPTSSVNVINEQGTTNVDFKNRYMNDGSNEEMRSPERIYFDNWD